MKYHLPDDESRPPVAHRKGASPIAIQKYWLVCCQSTQEHRFDCTEVARAKRGDGPFLPVHRT